MSTTTTELNDAPQIVYSTPYCPQCEGTGQKTGERKTLTIRHGMSRAIFTKYLGPTEKRPSRIRAYDTEGFSATVSKSAFANDQEATNAAVQKLCAKMKWTGELISGGTKEGNVFVFVDGARS